MQNLKLIRSGEWITRIYLKETIIILCISILVPFLIHYIPTGRIPAGAMLLALFYAPFIAVFSFRLSTAIITSLLSPAANYLLTGSPHFEVIPTLILQLLLFVFAVYFIKYVKILKFFNAVVSYILSLGLVTLFLSKSPGGISLVNSVINSVPGIVILFFLNFILIKAERIHTEW